eukprot:TRINITY_DN49820_c0_g1_i1.p1 TRINITY_DN49820_c0_g1~~TRINITY_DN49820_c0_g1_i1.p1  ORF type:complete len:481 (+),score=38.08 TRINITY_DN49820_c0_g1_i1:65-1507(+)
MLLSSRKLGYFEAYAASVPSCVVSMVAVLSSSRGDDQASRLTDAAICRAVTHIVSRHPHLRSTLAHDADGDLCLHLQQNSSSSEDIIRSHLKIVTVSSADEWMDIVQDESNTGFDLEGSAPLWKVVFIRGPSNSDDVLLIKYHHAIGDGTSGYILINDFLAAATATTNIAAGEQNEALPMLPSIDDMCFPKGRTLEDEKYVQEALVTLRKKRTDWYPRLEYSSEPPAGNAHSILYRDGTEDGLKRLLETCRSRGVTIGAVLGVATFFAVAKMNHGKDPDGSRESTGEGDNSFHFDFDMDVNLRKRLPTSLGNDHVGAFIGMMSFNLSLEPSTKFWDFVQSMYHGIGDALDEKQHFHYLEANKRLDKMVEEKPLENRAWKGNDGHAQDMNFSNIGRYPFSPDYGAVSVEKIYCVGGGWCPKFGAYVFLIPSVRYLNFSLVYESGAKLNDTTAKEFFNLVCDLVESTPSADESFTLGDYLKG